MGGVSGSTDTLSILAGILGEIGSGLVMEPVPKTYSGACSQVCSGELD